MPKKSLPSRTDLVKRSIKPEADLTGKPPFGEWTVLEYAGTKNGHWFKCRCSCGHERTVHGGELRMGRSTSCGHDGSTFKHGHKRRKQPVDKVYNTWAMMRDRCNNPENSGYRNYGGRGIKVCERWDSYENFLADMGQPPTPDHTIERMNNNGNYEPGNCCWATRAEQRRNCRRIITVTRNGVTMCLKDWCTKLGVPYTRIYQRVFKGMPPLEALFGKEE